MAKIYCDNCDSGIEEYSTREILEGFVSCPVCNSTNDIPFIEEERSTLLERYDERLTIIEERLGITNDN